MITGVPARIVIETIPGRQHVCFRLDDGSTLDLPSSVGRFIRRSDVLRAIAPGLAGVLIERSTSQSRFQWLLCSSIGYVAQPRRSENGAGLLARAELPKTSSGLKALFLSGDAIRRYFHGVDNSKAPENLYTFFGVSPTATPADLRMAWRVRQLQSDLRAPNPTERIWIERGFNVLAHPDLRSCYDVLRRDEDAAPVFPYGGFGLILVEGNLSNDSEAFFADRILAYKPDMSSRKVSLLLRQCEFLVDRIICRDRHRKFEVWLDSCLLPGLNWDLTWNHWKQWLRSRIEVDATFVRTGKYRLRKNEWALRTWYTALPSRLRVTLPEGIAADVERARAIHVLLGEYADVVETIRAQAEKQPVEHVRIQDWFDRLGVSSHLRPQDVTWRPDYEPYYFEQLRKRCTTWFLFRAEYLFVWANVLISEIPQPGHATYVFAKPPDIPAFMRRYSRVTREDMRRNRNNAAAELGFVGRVVRGRNKKRWLTDVQKLAGENTDYVDAFK